MTRTIVDPLDVMILHSQGHTVVSAAAHLGVKPNTIHYHARDMGLLFHRPPHSTRVPDTVRDQVRDLWDAGHTQGEIAAKVGRSRSWVGKMLRGER